MICTKCQKPSVGQFCSACQLGIDPIMAEMLRSSGLPEAQWAARIQELQASIVPERGVSKSAELERILALPRRLWETNAEDLAEKVTMYLRAPGGVQKLRPVQAATLKDAHDQGGAFCPQRVSAGKTLSSLLGFTVLGAQRPLLLIPAKLREKTMRDMNRARKNWLVPGYVRIVSYELVGRPQSTELLNLANPDVIVMDECHKARSRSAQVTKRIGLFLETHPDTKVIALSGTIMKRSIIDYAHISGWCLKHKSPTPQDFNTRTEWGLAIDDQKEEANALAPGALIELCNDEERALLATDRMKAIRTAYRRRLTESPGVVATREGALSMSLVIEPKIIKDPVITAWAHHMRTTWERPDRVEIIDGFAVWRHLREIACGFFYRWNPPPPREWSDARRAWAAFVRKVLSNNRRGIESETAVIDAIEKGLYERDELQRWREVKDQYDPEKHKEAVWLSDGAVDAAIQWAMEEKGIVWVEHVAFGERMAAKSGLPFYQNQGLTKIGKKFIEDHPHGTPMIASREPNYEGRNLQFGWSTMYMTSPHTAGYIWEQTIGREHRDGQEADEVTVTVAASLPEQLSAFDQACKDARAISDTTGQEQKLCYADITIPPVEDRAGLWMAK